MAGRLLRLPHLPLDTDADTGHDVEPVALHTYCGAAVARGSYHVLGNMSNRPRSVEAVFLPTLHA